MEGRHAPLVAAHHLAIDQAGLTVLRNRRGSMVARAANIVAAIWPERADARVCELIGSQQTGQSLSSGYHPRSSAMPMAHPTRMQAQAIVEVDSF